MGDPNTPRHEWLDVVRGLAMAWIFLVHVVEKVLCCPAFGNPGEDWPPLAERLGQLRPLPLEGLSGIIVNALRYVGWLGDMGVQIFVVASGFGLALSALKPSGISAGEFYSRRLMRILPLWWAAHLLFVATSLGLGGLEVSDWRTWASFAGLRFLPSVLYFFAPAWWFFGLILQLYAVFPLLARWLRDWPLQRFLLLVCVGSIGVRLVGLLASAYFIPSALDWWSRGGLFVSRLPEFSFGMAFAALIHRCPHDAARWFRGTRAITGSLAVMGLGIGALFTLTGLSFAMLLTGASFTVLFYALAPSARGVLRPVAWFGKNSLPFFLVHDPVVAHLGPTNHEDLGMFSVRTVLAFAVSLGLGQVLTAGTDLAVARIARSRQSVGTLRTALRGGIVLAALAMLALAGELMVRRFAPQEVLGWGEREALQPDDRYGYRLAPNKETRLRWLSYDYLVRSNELGFPGPHFPVDQAPDAVRILITGDAYESAEGVDTELAWPRLLEGELRTRGVIARVSNFAVTGWGPNQYAKVVEDFAPSHRPHLVIVGFFVNEYEDVQTSEADFQRSIGFGLPGAFSVKSLPRLPHLKNFLRGEVAAVRQRVSGKFQGGDVFFGYFLALERARLDEMEAAAPLIRERLGSIQASAKAVGARVLVVQVPAPAQVCARESVRWFPRKVELTAPEYDPEQPQRLTTRLCEDLSLAVVDLRPGLRAGASERPCQPSNLHWTAAGHRIVARVVADELIGRRLLP